MSAGTPVRAVRVAGELWDRVRAEAAAEDLTVSELVREALELRLSAGPARRS